MRKIARSAAEGTVLLKYLQTNFNLLHNQVPPPAGGEGGG